MARALDYSDAAVSAWRKAGAPFDGTGRTSWAEIWRWRDAQIEAKAAAKHAPTDQADAERRKAIADAEMAEHKLAVARGEVVPVAQVSAAWERHLAGLRAKIAAVPGKWARALIGLGKPNQVQAALHPLVQELFAVLAQAEPAAEEDAA